MFGSPGFQFSYALATAEQLPGEGLVQKAVPASGPETHDQVRGKLVCGLACAPIHPSWVSLAVTKAFSAAEVMVAR